MAVLADKSEVEFEEVVFEVFVEVELQELEGGKGGGGGGGGEWGELPEAD